MAPGPVPHSAAMGTRQRRLGWLAGGLALILLVGMALVFGTGALVPSPSPGPVALATPQSPTPIEETAVPAPTSAPTPQPSRGMTATRIVIPRLGIDLPVYEGDGFTAELGKAAHYPTTAWPGSGSLIYLYSHARDGNFIGLWDAEVGDRVDLELEDGSTASYVVSRVDANVAWNDLSKLEPTGHELLRLQTCNSSEETAPRFIVEAVPR